jgi:hypothetical protein
MTTVASAARSAANAKALIARADRNHDGRVSRAELTRAQGQVGGTARQLLQRAVLSSSTVGQARRVVDGALAKVRSADRNHDGFISASESKRLSSFQKLLAPSGGAQAPGSSGGGHQVGGYGTLRPPAELAHYGNGRIPTARLASIGIGGHRLYAPAAAAFRQLRAAAARVGVNIGVTDSYRSYAQQVDLARRKGLYANGGLAATPGKSNHGWGLALDVNVNGGGLAWLRQNARRFGFAEAVPREPWHWEYRPGQAR